MGYAEIDRSRPRDGQGRSRPVLLTGLLVIFSTIVVLAVVGIGAGCEGRGQDSKGVHNGPMPSPMKTHGLESRHGAPLLIRDEQGWGFARVSGGQLCTGFPDARDFSESVAAVAVGESEQRRWGYINESCRWVIEPKFLEALPFAEGLAAVKTDDGFQFIDHDGKPVTDARFASAEPFSEGFALVSTIASASDSRSVGVFFIGRTGIPLSGDVYSAAFSFREGLAPVLSGGKWGYIDRSGRIVIEPQFEAASQFSDGLAAVKTDGVWGYIGLNGQVVIGPSFEAAGSFGDGLAPVLKDGLYGYIDRTGVIRIPAEFELAGQFRGGLAKVLKGSEFHFINRNGDSMIQVGRAISVTDFDDDFARVVRVNGTVYIRRDGTAVVFR